jgi:hypothetical protein
VASNAGVRLTPDTGIKALHMWPAQAHSSIIGKGRSDPGKAAMTLHLLPIDPPLARLHPSLDALVAIAIVGVALLLLAAPAH